MIDFGSILRHIQYYYWCVCDAWEDYMYPKCKECGIKKGQ